MSPEMPLNPVIYPIVIAVSTLVVALLLLSFAMSSVTLAVRKRRKAALAAWKDRGLRFVLPPAQANFLNEPRAFGVGNNGTLVLTESALCFAQVMPEREITIPLSEIASVHLVPKFNGRWGGGPFLVIKRSVGDLTGFQLGSARKWAEVIDETRLGKRPLATSGELVVV